MLLQDKGETLKAFYSYNIDNTQAAGCEITRKLGTDCTSVEGVYQKTVLSGGTLKIKLMSSGLGAASYSFSPMPKALLNIAGQFDVTSLEKNKNSKVGIAMEYKA